jgi:hypothetical protein
MSTLIRGDLDADLCSSSEMPRWNVDNMMTHIAAAALIVDDNEVDVNDLRDDLKIDNKEYVCHINTDITITNTEIEFKHTLQNWAAGSAHQQQPILPSGSCPNLKQ